MSDQVKGSLLMDSLTQISEDHDLSPISEPSFNAEAIIVPDSGPMTFEFDIEVRPQFDLPDWKGLKIDRPVREFTSADVEERLQYVAVAARSVGALRWPRRSGRLPDPGHCVPGGWPGVSRLKEQTLRIRPVLSFRDGKITAFDKLMAGVKAGEIARRARPRFPTTPRTKRCVARRSMPNSRCKTSRSWKCPKLTPAFLDELGGFADEAELRDAIKESLERRLEYSQRQEARKQILASLTVAANWDLAAGIAATAGPPRIGANRAGIAPQRLQRR